MMNDSVTINDPEEVIDEVAALIEDDEPLLEMGVVQQGWAIYKELVHRLGAMYHGEVLARLSEILNCLRLDSSIWDKEKGEFFINSQYASLLDDVKEQINQLYEIKLAAGVQGKPITLETFSRLGKLETTLYRFHKEYMKRNRPVPLALLTPGTVVEYMVKHVDKEPMIATVKEISVTELGYGVVICEEKQMNYGSPYTGFFPTSEHICFNSSHIVRVIKHVPGLLKREHTKHQRTSIQNFVEMDSLNIPGKSKNTYVFHGESRFIVAASLSSFIGRHDPDQCVSESFYQFVYDNCPGLKVDGENTGWNRSTVTVNKKKLKRFVRQNYNRFQLTKSHQEKLERQYQESLYRSDDDD